MNDLALDLYGALTEPATLTIKRVLPGPVDRVWTYLTDQNLRRQWLCAGPMELKEGASFEWVWRNDELTSPPGERPEGFGAEHRMQGRILEIDPPRKLTYDWPGAGEVTFELIPRDSHTLLTVVHRRIPDRKTTVGVSAGWHAHLDLLAVRMAGQNAEPFWDAVARLRKDYDSRTPK